MVFRKLLIFMIVTLLLSSVVFAVDRDSWDQCVSNNNNDLCSDTLCVGNKYAIACQEPKDNIRNFLFTVRPVNCNSALKWNNTEEMRFVFDLDLDAKSLNPINSESCSSYDSPFNIISKKARYTVPYDFLNFVDLYKITYIDKDGWTYLTEPKSTFKNQLGDILTDEEIDEKFGNVKTEPMVKNMYSVLSCEFDCDYTGATDNQLDGAEYDDYGATRDYTYSKRFVTLNSVAKYEDEVLESFSKDCDNELDLSFGGIAKSIKCFSRNAQFVSYSVSEYLRQFFLDDEEQYRYSYEYASSKKQSVAESFTCKYPKSDYNNQEVEVRVYCRVGKTWEGIFSQPSEGLSFPPYLIDQSEDGNCLDNGMCKVGASLKFILNSTLGEAQYTNLSFITYNLTDEEIFKEIEDSEVYEGSYRRIEADEDIEESFTTFQRDLKRDKVVVQVLGLSEYVISTNLIITYLLQFSIVMMAFIIMMNSFKMLIGSIKRLFNFKALKNK